MITRLVEKKSKYTSEQKKTRRVELALPEDHFEWTMREDGN